MFEDLYFNNIEKELSLKNRPPSLLLNILINTYRTFERSRGFTNDDMVGARLIFIYEKKLRLIYICFFNLINLTFFIFTFDFK